MSKKGQETQQATKRKTLAITQRGIRTDSDLSDFFEAAIADVDAGRADIQQMKRMTTITGQMIALQNLRLKVAALTRKGLKQQFVLTAEDAGIAK